MRNKLAHEYFGINVQFVFNVVKNDLDSLRAAVLEIFKKQEETSQ